MLVVDDEATVRDVVGQYLARDGFRVVTTGDGREVTASWSANRRISSCST